ncbi:MAG: rubredoxin, partial [Synechococcaceae bacterium WB9_2_112]|nr:rubredoxin [Synechococcaceae bacterium WB9_2_112]
MSEETLPEELEAAHDPIVGSEPEEPAESATAADDPDTHRFECRSCGFVYD